MFRKLLDKLKQSKPFQQITRLTQQLRLDYLKPPFQRPASLTGKLILASAFVTFLWKTRFVSDSFMLNHFTFSPHNIRNFRFHTILTHNFTNHSIWSLLFNSLTMYFIGGAIQSVYGVKVLLTLLITSSITSSLSHFITAKNSPYIVPQSGIEGTIAGLLAFYMLKFRGATFVVFVLPVPAWALGTFMIVHALFFDASNRELGGLLGGAGCYLGMIGL